MNKIIFAAFFGSLATAAQAAQSIPNPLIDYDQFQRIVIDSKAQREQHRLTESEFLADMREPGVIVLDARTESRYRLLHIKGAVNLPFTEFTAATLAQIAPDKNAKILIYCNNNFRDSPVAFASKTAAASLNLSTYTSLRAYGYTNIYELGPLLKMADTKIPFEGSTVN
jgi:rhodanese-related sulfurtransferase